MKIYTTTDIWNKGNESLQNNDDTVEKYVNIKELKLFLQKGANANWEAEQVEKEVLRHNVSCNNICNIASDLRYKLNQLFEKLGGHI